MCTTVLNTYKKSESKIGHKLVVTPTIDSSIEGKSISLFWSDILIIPIRYIRKNMGYFRKHVIVSKAIIR